MQYINKEYRRSGTLWEGRHKSSLVDADQYLFRCYRYIEMNPVRANMVEHPADYKWSSFMVNAQGSDQYPIKPHPLYLALDKDQALRCEAYRDMFKTDLNGNELHEIRNATQFSMPLGNNRFKEEIERVIGYRLGYANRGRPKVSENGAIYVVCPNWNG